MNDDKHYDHKIFATLPFKAREFRSPMILSFSSKKIYLIIGFFLIFISFSSCKYTSNESDVRIVKYEVIGTAHSVNITFINASGETETVDNIKMPWERNIYPKKGYLYLSVQNERHHGSVTARIWVDGKITKESTASGPFATASINDVLQ